MHCCIGQVIISQPLLCVSQGYPLTLTWDMAANNACGSFYGYNIYRSSNPNGPFTPDTTITSQATTSWVDNNTSSSRYWFYYVEDSFNCPGASYQIADTIGNKNPNPPIVNFVTVNADSSETINWSPSTSDQTKYYIIYFVSPNGNHVTLDTVYGRYDTTWTDHENPYASPIGYAVAAADSCPNNAASSYTTTQQTILLSHGEARCNPSIPLTWTPYVNMTGGLGGYNVYVSRNDSAFMLMGTVDSPNVSYSYTNFNNGDSVQVYIEAFSANDSTVQSTSNYERFVASVIKPPAFCYLTWLSVDTASNAVDMRWIVDNNAKVLEYQVYNSEDGVNYNIIPDASSGVQQVPVPVARFASYADSTVQPQYGPYYYQVQAYDSCMTYTLAPPGEIISLQGTLSDYYQISLSWNQFQLFGATVTEYDLYRDIGSGMVFDKSFGPGVTACIDSVFQDTLLPGQFCYLIRARYTLSLPLANSYDTSEITFSNIQCVDHRPIIYIPNAFVVNGNVADDAVFKPRIIFGDPAGYDMTIWDRYGGKIFESHDVNTGWDGTNSGHVVDQGGYPYLIQFTALDGTPVSRSGIVLLLVK